MSGNIIAPSATICRAQMRLEQAETIITGLSVAYSRISTFFKRTPAAKDEHAASTRRALLRASA